MNPETQEINIPNIDEPLKKYEREDSSIEYWKIVDNLNKKPKSVEDAQARIGIADQSINKTKEEEKTLDEKIVAEEKQIEALCEYKTGDRVGLEALNKRSDVLYDYRNKIFKAKKELDGGSVPRELFETNKVERTENSEETNLDERKKRTPWSGISKRCYLIQ